MHKRAIFGMCVEKLSAIREELGRCNSLEYQGERTQERREMPRASEHGRAGTIHASYPRSSTLSSSITNKICGALAPKHLSTHPSNGFCAARHKRIASLGLRATIKSLNCNSYGRGQCLYAQLMTSLPLSMKCLQCSWLTYKWMLETASTASRLVDTFDLYVA